MIMSAYRCFLVGFNALSLPVQDLTGFFETCEEVVNWYGILPGQLFVASSLDAKTLNRRLGGRFPKEFFVVARLDPSATGGWLPPEAWDMINQPQPATIAEFIKRELPVG
jgi:hypothetical protein